MDLRNPHSCRLLFLLLVTLSFTIFSLGCKILCLDINVLPTWKTVLVIISLMRYLLLNFVWRSFLDPPRAFFFFIVSICFYGVRFRYSQVLVIFLLWCFPNLAVLFLLWFFFSHFSLLAKPIFQCQIPFLYSGCIFSLIYQFFLSVWFLINSSISTVHMRWFILSCDFVNVHSPKHFLST